MGVAGKENLTLQTRIPGFHPAEHVFCSTHTVSDSYHSMTYDKMDIFVYTVVWKEESGF